MARGKQINSYINHRNGWIEYRQKYYCTKKTSRSCKKKIMKFHDIAVLIWDFDGTFYKPNPALFAAVRQAEYRTIIAHTGWTHEHTIEAFEKLYKKVYSSATETV